MADNFLPLPASLAMGCTFTSQTNVCVDSTCVPAAPTISTTTITSGQRCNLYGFNVVGSGGGTWSATGLPAGLTINSVNGLISGRPTAAAATYSVTVTLSNGTLPDATAVLSLVISASVGPTVVSPLTTLPTAVDGTPYSPVLVSWINHLADGTMTGLPAGLIFTTNSGGGDGVISGTPTVNGSFTPAITLVDRNGCAQDGTASWTMSVSSSAGVRTHYRGNWAGVVPGSFVAGDFITPSATFEAGSFAFAVLGTRNGTYVFPPQVGVVDIYQVFWFADSLLTGSPSYTQSGFPVVLNPGVNTPYQSLTIGGIAGKVYVTANTNNGGFTMTAT